MRWFDSKYCTLTHRQWNLLNGIFFGVEALERRYMAALMLARATGEDAYLPWVQSGLRSQEIGVVEFAAAAVPSYGRRARRFLPDLLDVLRRSDDSNFDRAAIAALSSVGAEAVPYLMGVVREANVSTQDTAIEALSMVRPATQEIANFIVLWGALQFIDLEKGAGYTTCDAVGRLGVDTAEVRAFLHYFAMKGTAESDSARKAWAEIHPGSQEDPRLWIGGFALPGVAAR